MSMRLIGSLLATFALVVGAAAPALANTPNYRALLVGVSEYPNLKKELWLDGPRNDVMRMREVLAARGVPAQNITVLADGVPGAELPTRRRILDELERLARTARSNDYIIVHMAGHGSQQPVPAGSPHAGDETDGLFEIFLPRDVQNWGNKASGSEGEVPNAILDHEIRTQVDRMTAAGAFVWGIFDSCHSATLVRSAGNAEVKLRQVTPADLGVPVEAMDRSTARAAASARASTPVAPKPRPAVPGQGGSVFFYAAQTFEPTPEMRLPAGAPDRRSHGLFSFTIMQALEGGAGMTYQQLGQQVLTRYGGLSEARVTPLFTGTSLQSGLMGQTVSSVKQWPLVEGTQLSIRAGSLADLNEGAVLAILPAAISRTEEAVGYVQVAKSELTSSTLAPVEHAGKPARALADLKAGKVARLVQPALKFELSVGTDLAGCASPCPFEPAIAKLKSAAPGTLQTQVRWVDGAQTAQLKLVADGNRLWLAPPSLSGSQWCRGADRAACLARMDKTLVYLEAAGSATAEKLSQQLGTMLHGASRASNLMRVATSLSSTQAASQLQLSLQHVPAAGSPVEINPAQPPKLKPGDKVRVTMENKGRTAMDVTVLYLDSKYGIGAMFPDEGASNRLEAGARLQMGDLEITDSTLGTERLAVIAAEARSKGEMANYSFLAQPTMESSVVTRSVGASRDAGGAAADVFRDAGFAAHVTRGMPRPAAPPENTGMQVFTWQVVP
jgi:hypothetical protein